MRAIWSSVSSQSKTARFSSMRRVLEALGQGYQVLLDLPAQNHLGYGFTGLGGDGFEGGVLEQVSFAAQG